MIDAEIIRDLLDTETGLLIKEVSVHDCIDSTNKWLMQRVFDNVPGKGIACLAEHQTAGRGRYGRTWISPVGNLYLSLLWRYLSPSPTINGLSLACGVAVVHALEKLGVTGLALKWPNDVLWGKRKLAGLLIDVSGEASYNQIVIGVGLNVRMPEDAAALIDQPWIALEQIPGGLACSRNHLAAAILNGLTATITKFTVQGLVPFLADWKQHDALRGERVQLMTESQKLEGEYIGIAADGALQLATGGTIVSCYSGEVVQCRSAWY